MASLNHPLENVRVLDLGRHQAGPRCAQVLARMGAEVIKVERLGGEETRYHGPWVKKQSSYWVQYNSGKKSLSIDLRKEQGKEILRGLVKVSDVVVQNFRPGTIEKMGFSYDVLKELNRRIIMVNVSAYGQFGPYRDKIGYDPIGQTMSGITMVTGEEGMPPIRTGVPIIDRITALHSAIGTLAALHEREVSGEGQSIDVCLADTGYSLTEIPVSAYHGNRKPPSRGDSGAPPTGIYPCKEGWVLLSAGDQHHWHRVCNALGKPEWLEDPRFITRPERAANRDIVNAALKDLLATMTMDEAIAHFTKHDVVAAPVNTIPLAEADPHPWERRAMVDVPDFLAGEIAVSGDFWHFSRTPAVVGSTPRVGEHNEELICGLLGYSQEDLARFKEEQVIGDRDEYDEVPG
ncbi:MAG: CoA transferase [Dehalococcoidia bacterium]|nr:CoA transferase [Dehalococcoidia bacterium]MDP6226096.1 CoA transferase [Dehalococcoidia bacterium]MDP7083069.1 CoA transferase [Dehalococcoidia bacterium]MDP7200484.1 CoA transferase [Dehalococcoidia bacterium]MDP7510826.1 CoA transferase [Dehalococcoidia bacterium]